MKKILSIIMGLTLFNTVIAHCMPICLSEENRRMRRRIERLGRQAVMRSYCKIRNELRIEEDAWNNPRVKAIVLEEFENHKTKIVKTEQDKIKEHQERKLQFKQRNTYEQKLKRQKNTKAQPKLPQPQKRIQQAHRSKR